MQPGGIGPPLVQGREQRLPGDGVQGKGGSGVEVGHTCTLARVPAPCPEGPDNRGDNHGAGDSTPTEGRAARWAPSPRDPK
ncbi:hypothetical protein GCM10010405_28890 [Streptomyces macrosporus]|uniref:Uncharacterized protein n=1 Tax=Streptomyces macrosporus TaxID=44032 RepID=A0ABP5X2U8_9ACTN